MYPTEERRVVQALNDLSNPHSLICKPQGRDLIPLADSIPLSTIPMSSGLRREPVSEVFPLEPISELIFEEVCLVQHSHPRCQESSLVENARIGLSVSWARARSERRLSISRKVIIHA